MKDLLLGAADLYSWKDIKVWAASARASGFDGDIILLTYRVDGDVFVKSEKFAINVYTIDYNAFGRAISHNDKGRNTQCHQLRFFHMWQLLTNDNLWKNYEHIISTDVRDVWFQQNPQEFLKPHGSSIFETMNGYSLLASSEGIKYKDEPWGYENMINGFGPIVWQVAQNWTIYNVGVLAGKSKDMTDLFLTLYSMTQNRYIPSDQSSYGILVNSSMSSKFALVDHYNEWACQCGTTMDPTKSQLWPSLITPQPIIENDVVLSMPSKQPFSIVHQYDRVPELNNYVTSLYEKE